MGEGLILALILIAAVAFIIFATSILKLHPFLVLIIAAFAVGLTAGLSPEKTISAISGGFGGLMSYIGLVIVFGTIIGVILENSRAAIRIADVVLRIFGKNHPAFALSIIGAIVSIPVFCDSGFVILSSLNKTISRRAKISISTTTVALASGLYATHTLVVPTPGPIAAAGNLGMTEHMGTLIWVGLLTALPAIFIGYFWALRCGKDTGDSAKLSPDELGKVFADMENLPSAMQSFIPLLLPIILIGIGSTVKFMALQGGTAELFIFLGNPMVALLIGVFSCIPLLPALDEERLSGWVGKGVSQAGPILLITGAGGAFGSVLKATPLSTLIGEMISGGSIYGMLFILIAYVVAAALKSSQGSSTAALVITSSLMAPLLSEAGIADPLMLALIVMAIGGGAMTVSHANDSYFWVVTQFSGLSVNDAYRSFTMVTLLQGLTVLLTTLALYFLLV